MFLLRLAVTVKRTRPAVVPALGAILSFVAPSLAQDRVDSAQFTVVGTVGATATFETAKSLRTVEFGRREPLGPGLRIEVLAELERGGRKVEVWQRAGNANSRFFVDAPKVSFGPGQPLSYSPGYVEPHGTSRFRMYPGSYGQYTSDPAMPVILSQRGKANSASIGFLATSTSPDGAELLAALGAAGQDAGDVDLMYTSSAEQPMVLAAVTCRSAAALAYRPWQERDGVEAPPGLRGLIGRFVDPEKPDNALDLTVPNKAALLADYLERFKMEFVVGCRFVSFAELLGKEPDDASNDGITARVVFAGAAGRGASDPKGPALKVMWVDAEGNTARVEWFDAASGKPRK